MTVTGGNRRRAWATTIVVLLSTLLSGILSTSMVWPGSPTVCADVAVTVAVNPDHTPTAHLLDYRITAGQSHGPPALVDGLASRWHTYYVLAGETPVLVHNSNCFNISPEAEAIASHANQRFMDPGGFEHYVRGVDPKALDAYVDGVLDGVVPSIEVRYLNNGRVAYWDPAKGAVVIEDGIGGTVFTPTNGKTYFDDLQ